MSRLISFSKVGNAHDAPRFWIEGHRLSALGFATGTPLQIDVNPRGLALTPSLLSDRLVSFRRSAGTTRPIIDINSHRLLGHLSHYDELKVIASMGKISITPSVRAFAVLRAKQRVGPLRILDVFCGGGTLSDAVAGRDDFRIIAGVEMEPDYADEFAAKHKDADIITGDFRKMLPTELPSFDVLLAGVPCSDHAGFGRALRSLAGRPELGDFGALYIPLLNLISSRLPVACVLENVANYGNSLAGQTIVSHLRSLGYHVFETILRPNEEWAEPTTRNRWVCIATLQTGFILRSPMRPFSGPISDYLDKPDAAGDRADAERIAVTVEGLRKHNARHAAAGHGFSISVLDGSEQSAPTITKNYHKINSSGFFIQTPYGPRLLRKAEIARLHGQTILSPHYATAAQMMGQGVLTRVFSSILDQLACFLASNRKGALCEVA